MSIFATYEQFRDGFATSATLDLAGRKVWPADKVQQAFSFAAPNAQTISGGNGGPILGASSLINESIQNGATFPWRITANGEQADSPSGTDLFDWYLSQRTDEVTRQYLRLYRLEGEPSWPFAGTYSGTVYLGLTALGTSTFGATLTAGQLSQLFDHVFVYAQRKADDFIWVFDIRRILFTPVPT